MTSSSEGPLKMLGPAPGVVKNFVRCMTFKLRSSLYWSSTYTDGILYQAGRMKN
jgi:hypothetical protein